MAAPALPLTTDDFAALIALLAPSAGTMAVAVSGGADSMALCLLAHRWASHTGRTVLALTVDHGLRPDSAAEATQVAGWLHRRGIRHAVLPWTGPKPTAGLQAAARATRYRLLAERCRAEGIADVMVAHHAGDQAETFLMRRERGSGPRGLAAMPAARHVDGIRVLRPLLTVPKGRLIATLQACGQDWVEDPSNANQRFARVRTRLVLASGSPSSTDRLAALAHVHGVQREQADAALMRLLAECAFPDPAGFCRIGLRELLAAPPAMAATVLARVVTTVGGLPYLPTDASARRAVSALAAGRGHSLHRCVLWQTSVDEYVACRELRGLNRRPIEPGSPVMWDARFLVAVAPGRGRPALAVGPLGRSGWVQVRPRVTSAIPHRARLVLPTVWAGERVVAVPHLQFGAESGATATFLPAESLAPPHFAVVSAAE